MALFKSQLVTQASGSVGGITFTRSSSGMVIRGRSMPVNPRTSAQQEIRSATSALATRWVEFLNEEQRVLWTQYAKNVARKNKLGDSIFLTGLQTYIGNNVPRIQAGIGVIDTAPTVFDRGESLQGGGITQAAVTPFAVTLGWTPVGTTLDGDVLVYVSIPQNPSINFFKGPYRFNASGTVGAASLALAQNPSWVEGQKIFVRARVAYADGRLSASSEYSFVLTGTPV